MGKTVMISISLQDTQEGLSTVSTLIKRPVQGTAKVCSNTWPIFVSSLNSCSS